MCVLSSPPASASQGTTGTLPAPDPPSKHAAAHATGSPQQPRPEALWVSHREGKWLLVSSWRFWGAAGAGMKGGSPRAAGGALQRHDFWLSL